MVLTTPLQMHTTLSAKNAYALVYARIYNGAEASLPWKLLRTYLESCASIVQPVVCCPLLLPLLLSRLNPSPDAVRSRNLSKSTLTREAVPAAVLHKHHSIIRIGAGLIQFVDHGAYPSQKSIFAIHLQCWVHRTRRPHTRTNTHTHAQTHTHTHTHTHSISLVSPLLPTPPSSFPSSLSPPLSFSLSFCFCLSLTHKHTLTSTHADTLSLTHSRNTFCLVPSYILSVAHKHMYTHAQTLSHTHTHTHTRTLTDRHAHAHSPLHSHNHMHTLTHTHTHIHTHYLSHAHTRTRAHRCAFVCLYVEVVMYVCEFVCGFVRVCTCACVRVCVRNMQEKSILVV